MKRESCILRGVFALCLFVCAVGPAGAQDRFAPLSASGQYRGGVFVPVDGAMRLYAPVYDSNEVWGFDAGLARVERIPVGEGPVSLAVAPSGVMACVNRLAASVSLIRPGAQESYATVPVAEGATAIAALPGGGFAVACSFGDAVYLISEQGGSGVLDGAPEVPVALAAQGDYLAVAGRVTPSVRLFALPGGAAAGEIALPAPALAIQPFHDGRFVVAGAAGLQVLDPGTRKVVRSAGLAADGIAWSGRELWALTQGNEVVVLDAALAAVRRMALPGAAALIAAGPGGLAVFAPAASRAYVAFAPAGAVPELRVAEATEVREAVAVPAAQEAAAIAPAAAGVEEAQPVEEAATDASEAAAGVPSPVAQPGAGSAPASAMSEGTPEPSPEAAQAAAAATDATDAPGAVVDEATPVKTGPRQVRKAPILTESTRAPQTLRPSASPLDQLNRKTLTDALLQPTQFGSVEAGFEPPDWRQPIRDPQADSASLRGSDIQLRGNVRLRLGEMVFEADEFDISGMQSQYHAKGNIRLQQRDSLLEGEEIYFYAADPAAIEAPPILKPQLTEEELARQRFSLGRIDAYQVHVQEPTRRLQAGRINYDFLTRSGLVLDATGSAPPWYYGAEEITILGPDDFEARNFWITTCDHDPPHTRIFMKEARVTGGQVFTGTNARLQIAGRNTPFWVPKWRNGGVGTQAWNLDFDSGRRAELGYFVNVGQRFEVSREFALGPRIVLTQKEGVALGMDADYDYMTKPSSRLYRTAGDFRTLYTTEDRGYVEWHHRWEYDNDLVMRAQIEHWGDEEFFKDFYYDAYRNRTTPRTFVNLTFRQPGYIVTGTTRVDTHGWVRETERLPEATFHLIERPIAQNLYLTFDTVHGYNRREPRGIEGWRDVAVLRLTYDWDPAEWLNITPYWETYGVWYSDTPDGDAEGAFSNIVGVTAQTRLHREFGGFLNFEAFKHVFVPSITYSYRHNSALNPENSPRFDALDNINGHSRIETKLDNVFYGRDAQTKEVWQVGRITLYQGNDFYNELRAAEDYEVEIDLRPRPWWGFQLVGERHVISDDFDLDDPFAIQQLVLETLDRTFGIPIDQTDLNFNARFGDYNRVLSQLYFDQTQRGGKFSGRVGYAYSATESRVFNREILYGLGYRINENWALGFEHRYDFAEDKLRSQTYEIRRRLHEWEMALQFRERESGFDINAAFTLVAFPGSRIEF
jgi:hypothetical protein